MSLVEAAMGLLLVALFSSLTLHAERVIHRGHARLRAHEQLAELTGQLETIASRHLGSFSAGSETFSAMVPGRATTYSAALACNALTPSASLPRHRRRAWGCEVRWQVFAKTSSMVVWSY